MTDILDKFAYFDDVSNVQQEHAYTELQGAIPGIDGDRTMDQDRRENHEPDGFDNKEFYAIQKRRKRIIERLKKMRAMHKKLEDMRKMDGNAAFQPTPSYTSPYGATGTEGTLTYPSVEYYSGSVLNDPGAITNNPYNTTYQQAAERTVRLQLRASFFRSHKSA
jgi:hypothetical protein